MSKTTTNPWSSAALCAGWTKVDRETGDLVPVVPHGRLRSTSPHRLSLCWSSNRISQGSTVTPPSPQGLSRSEVDALIAERIEQFKATLERQGRLR